MVPLCQVIPRPSYRWTCAKGYFHDQLLPVYVRAVVEWRDILQQVEASM